MLLISNDQNFQWWSFISTLKSHLRPSRRSPSFRVPANCLMQKTIVPPPRVTTWDLRKPITDRLISHSADLRGKRIRERELGEWKGWGGGEEGWPDHSP